MQLDLLLLLLNLHAIVRIGTVLDILIKLDIEEIQDTLQRDLVGGQRAVVLVAVDRQRHLLLQAKLARGQRAFAAPQQHVLPLA